MTWLRVLMIMGLAAAASRVEAATPLRDMFPGPDVRMQIIDLPSAPPGKMAEAPGGGVVTTPAVLFTPASGEHIYGPAIVMIDQGPGSNPLQAAEPSRFAAARLAARGYTVLSLYTYLDRGYSLFPFEATASQIDAALYFLEQRGHEGFVLAGKGYGAIAATNYLKSNADEAMDAPGQHRVKALVLFSPLTELRAYPKAQLEAAGYAAQAAAAKASVERGSGRYPQGNTLEVGSTRGVAADPWMAAGPYNGPPESFESYWSPEAAQRNLDGLASVRLPTLVLGSANDPTYSEAHLRQIMHPDSLTVESLAGAGPGLAGASQARASDDMADWLATHGLGVKPQVVEAVIDTAAADGRSLPAVVYGPEGGADPGKPVVIFLHGRTEDPIQSSGQWVASRLAQHGFTVFTPRLRVSGTAGFASATLADEADDLGRWMAKLDALGYHRVVLVGHSNGGIYASVYMAKTHDPRVIGVAFMAPTLDERPYTIGRDGQAKVDHDLAEAKAAIDRGEGLTHMIGYMSAQTYWDVNNPDTLSQHSEVIKHYTVPTLSIVGRHDPLFEKGHFLQRFLAAQKPGLAKVEYLEKAGHGMRESKDAVVDDLAAWISATFPH